LRPSPPGDDPQRPRPPRGGGVELGGRLQLFDASGERVAGAPQVPPDAQLARWPLIVDGASVGELRLATITAPAAELDQEFARSQSRRGLWTAALLLPLALLAGKEVRALAGMAASIALLVAISAALFGPGLWLDWINVYLHPQQVAGVNATDWGHSWDESVSTCVALLGAPRWLANAAQGLAALVAIAVVWRAFRLGHPGRLAILLCADLLASPHVSNYDLLMLAVAGLIHLKALPESSRPLILLLPLAAWTAPIFNPPKVMPLGLITPLLLLGLIWAVFRAPGAEKPLKTP